jgi:hypothetical protein
VEAARLSTKPEDHLDYRNECWLDPAGHSAKAMTVVEDDIITPSDLDTTPYVLGIISFSYFFSWF